MEHIIKERYETFSPLVEAFKRNYHRFEKTEDSKKRYEAFVYKLRRQGGHRKIAGKKMRAKIDGNVDIEYIKDKRTYIIRKIHVTKKGVSCTFAKIYFFSMKGGIVYAMAVGEDLYLFTGHFFDRLAQRGYGTDHLNRIDTIKTFLLDFFEVQQEIGSVAFNRQKLTFMSYLGHGVGVGEFLPVEIGDSGPVMIALHLTYLSVDMINPELRSALENKEDTPELAELIRKHV
jgi:hypothetical protein